MTDYDSLKVDLGARNYNILIGNNLIANAGQHIAQVLPSKNVFIVTDDNVAPLYLKALQESLDQEGINHTGYIVPHGEQSKSLSQLEELMEKVFESKPDRKTTIIALGGGVIGDLTGFAASIILRGIGFIQIPTTLLAQVDSSVGGKTGINNKFGKNLVGTFYQPLLVLADTDCIKTLPKREFLAGYAEVIKYGVIGDIEFFSWLGDNIDKTLKLDNKTLQYIIKTSCAAKAKIVVEDERESGVRALLNFGHTFGHALEKSMDYSDKLLHGESVAIGMVFAAQLSHKMGLCEESEVKTLVKHLKKVGLETSPLEIKANWDIDELMEAMRQDKKASGGNLTFVLTRKIGDSFIKNNVDEDIVKETIAEFIG